MTWLSVHDTARVTGLRSATLSVVAQRENWRFEDIPNRCGRPRRMFNGDDVRAWAAVNPVVNARLVDFIEMKDEVDALDHAPTMEEMGRIALVPFSWKDVESLVETRPYRKVAVLPWGEGGRLCAKQKAG